MGGAGRVALGIKIEGVESDESEESEAVVRGGDGRFVKDNDLSITVRSKSKVMK